MENLDFHLILCVWLRTDGWIMQESALAGLDFYHLHCPPIVWKHLTCATILSHSWWKMGVVISPNAPQALWHICVDHI